MFRFSDFVVVVDSQFYSSPSNIPLIDQITYMASKLVCAWKKIKCVDNLSVKQMNIKQLDVFLIFLIFLLSRLDLMAAKSL